MEIYFSRTKETKTVVHTGTVNELLKKLNTNPETVIVAKENQILTKDTLLSNKDKICIIPVISGG